MTEEQTPISKERIEHIDRLYFDPKERAEGVNSIVMKARDDHREKYGEEDTPSDLDLMYWAIEFIAQQALAIDNPRFLAISVHQTRWMYNNHYTNAESLFPKPDKLAATKSTEGISGREEES